MATACASPLESLPHTVFPNDYQYTPVHNNDYQQQSRSATATPQQKHEQHVNYPPPPPPRSCFSPQLTRDHYQTNDEENSSIQYQVSFSLILYFFFVSQLTTLNDPRISFNNPFKVRFRV